jgi:hypothetical protein
MTAKAEKDGVDHRAGLELNRLPDQQSYSSGEREQLGWAQSATSAFQNCERRLVRDGRTQNAVDYLEPVSVVFAE